MITIEDVVTIDSCDLLFTYKKKSALSKAIWVVSRWNTDYARYEEMSHVVMAMSNKLIVESSVGGVLIKSITTVFKKNRAVTRRRVKLTREQRVLILMYCKQNAGVIKYAYLQLPCILFSRIFKFITFNTDKVSGSTCSEFMTDAFRSAGVDLAPGIPAHLTTPLDLYNSQYIVNKPKAL